MVNVIGLSAPPDDGRDELGLAIAIPDDGLTAVARTAS